ncbi:MAG: hypothetical protein ACRDZ3_06790 [Acidimicrobiia bacterium]
MAAGCQADSSGGAPDTEAKPAPTAPPRFESESGAELDGRFYAIVGGETSNDNRLFELRFSEADLRLLAEANRVSAVGACEGQLVVAAGQAEVGFGDHIQKLDGRRFQPLEGLGLTPGFSPAVGTDCRLAYTWVDRSSDALVDEVRVWDPATQAGKTLYRTRAGDGPLVSVAWSQSGELGVVRQGPDQAEEFPPGTPPGRPPALVVVGPDGTAEEIGLDGTPGVVTWGKAWIAVADDQGTLFIDPATAARSVLRGWRPVVWSPAGDRLLVKDAAERRTLGIVESSDLGMVKVVGRASAPVIDIDWLPAE